MAKIISGKEYLEQLKSEIKLNIKNYIIRPSVAVIHLGNDKINNMYVNLQEQLCDDVGIYYRHYQYESDTSELTIINKIKELNNDDYVHAILIMLPIPEKYNTVRLLNTISNSKDVDGLTDINIGRLISGRKTIVSCSSLAVLESLKQNNIQIQGKHVVIVGKGRATGRSLATILLNEGATVTICHSKTKNLAKHTIEADILITGVGKKNLIDDKMVKQDAVVIDLGCEYIDGKTYGDVNYTKVSKKASYITAQKGGIGYYTLAMFLKNIIMCHDNKK